MALRNVYDTMIHNVSYADNVVRVSVVIVYDGDAQIPFPTSKIRFVREVVNTFIGWLTHLVKAVSDEVFCFPLYVMNKCDIVKTFFIKLA